MFAQRLANEMKSPSDSATTMLPGDERTPSGGGGEAAPLNTAALSAVSSSAGMALLVWVTGPSRKPDPSSAKRRFQNSTASRTSGSRGSSPTDRIAMDGTLVQARAPV